MVLNITMANLVITLFACHLSCSPQFPCTLWQLSNGGHGNEEMTKKPNLLDTTLAQDTCDKPTQAIAMLFLSEPFCFLTSPIPTSNFSVEESVFSTANCNRVSFPYLRFRKTQAKTKTQAKNNLKTLTGACLVYSLHPKIPLVGVFLPLYVK